MEIINLSVRLSNDNLPLSTQDIPIYCFAHNDANIPMICQEVRKRFLDSKNIFILKNEKSMSGVSTYDKVKEQYAFFGIKINPIEYSNESINTRIESEAVIDWVIKNDIKKLIIIAPAFHILRASMTMISAMLDKKINIPIYSVSAPPHDWNYETITHQGKSKNTCTELIKMEMERILKYGKKGDIRSPIKIQKYLNERY